MKQEQVEKAFNKRTDITGYRATDGERIIEVVKEHFGVNITLAQAVVFWEEHSDTWAAGWLGIESDEEIVSAFRAFCSDDDELTNEDMEY